MPWRFADKLRSRGKNVNVHDTAQYKIFEGCLSLDIFTTKQSVPNTIILFILFVVLNPADLLIPSQTEKKYTRRIIK